MLTIAHRKYPTIYRFSFLLCDFLSSAQKYIFICVTFKPRANFKDSSTEQKKKYLHFFLNKPLETERKGLEFAYHNVIYILTIIIE